MSCLFCQIVREEIPANIIYQDKQVIAFHDIKPQAPVHCLVIPREHIATMNETTLQHTMLLGHMLQIAKQLSNKLEIAEAGYRLVINCNAEGGQEVFHLHLHLLGARPMSWPPG